MAGRHSRRTDPRGAGRRLQARPGAVLPAVQDHLDLRASGSRAWPRWSTTTGSHAAPSRRAGAPLATVFGEVRVARLAYRGRGHANLYPADAVLNLPAEQHSHGLRRLAAIEAARGSFDEAAGRSPGPPGSGWANARSSNSPARRGRRRRLLRHASPPVRGRRRAGAVI